MKFSRASSIEQIFSSLLLADQARATDRARINLLFNGAPPLDSDTEGTNVNFLESVTISHKGRGQLYSAFCNPDPLFTIDVDYGPVWKRRQWGGIIQKEMNKLIKDSMDYMEVQQSTFANVVLHGIGPSHWTDKEHWVPDDLGVEDVLLPDNTFRSMKGLPLFCIRRSYTVPQIQRMTRGRNVDPAWNMPLVKSVIEWADKESQALLNGNWRDTWSPEKIVERMKGSEYYYSAATPTINVCDFYFYDGDKKTSGWKRRMILDAWSDPGTASKPSSERKFKHGENEFLYDSGDRIYSDAWRKMIHFNFADCSSVAPFRYHSVRSIGYLLYSVCHLQNRLRCRFSDAAFEASMQYFRVANPADMDRLMKINLTDKGVLEEGVQFVRPEERWQINENLIMQAMNLNRQSMQDNSSSFTQDFDLDSKGNSQETATRTMAKQTASTALVGAMLNQAYIFETPRYREIGRRFCIEDSCDLDVKKFRVRCLKQGVPKEALNIDAWNIQPVRVIGSGNKMVASAIADKIMAVYAQLEPTSQREALKNYLAVNTDDYTLADRLVPEQPTISRTIHDTELVFGAILQGARPESMPGLNPSEVVETMLKQIGMKVQRIMQRDGVGTPDDVEGLQAAAQYTDAFIQMLAQDKNEKAKVAAYGKQLGAIMNEVKGMSQRQQQASKAQAAQMKGSENITIKLPDLVGIERAQALAKIGNQADPNGASKSKEQIAADKAAQKQAENQLKFEQKTQQDQQAHELDIQNNLREHAAELAKTSLETHHAVSTSRMKAKAKPHPRKSLTGSIQHDLIISE